MSHTTMSHLLNSLKENPFLLAPMAGITDVAFRSFMRQMGSGIVTTELVSATGIQYNSPRSARLMQYDPIQKPVGIQLFGENPQHLAAAAQYVERYGADFVDLNFGCPVPKVVKKGAGSAILKDLIALEKLLTTVKADLKIPLTIKIRTGWDETSRNAIEVANIAYNCGVEWVAIHGRTRAQRYSGKADWDFIGKVKQHSKIPIIGNGDIHTAHTAVTYLKKYNLDGVMIGRGCLKNPWIFHETYSLWKTGTQAVVHKDYFQILNLLKGILEKHNEEKIVMLQLKKFASWFSSGYPNSSKFRKELFSSKNYNLLYDTIMKYYDDIRDFQQKDTSHEPFLMGGHG